jgi:hypothetical protein
MIAEARRYRRQALECPNVLPEPRQWRLQATCKSERARTSSHLLEAEDGLGRLSDVLRVGRCPADLLVEGVHQAAERLHAALFRPERLGQPSEDGRDLASERGPRPESAWAGTSRPLSGRRTSSGDMNLGRKVKMNSTSWSSFSARSFRSAALYCAALSCCKRQAVTRDQHLGRSPVSSLTQRRRKRTRRPIDFWMTLTICSAEASIGGDGAFSK